MGKSRLATGRQVAEECAIEQGRAASITFDALGRFCEVLECQPGDILEWRPDNIDDKTRSSSNDEVLKTASEEVERKSEPSKSTKRQTRMIIIGGNKGAA
ncbi:MAG: helix-turn-helix domain-containing protein [Nostoc indistinguendum CM1-VF10]|nr:helix-turn-helix domain-containing protein [Nostoc indistinguendum CM1-VF10]